MTECYGVEMGLKTCDPSICILPAFVSGAIGIKLFSDSENWYPTTVVT